MKIRSRIIALLAAYAVALQALLVPLSIAVAAPIGVICASGSPNDTQQPAGHRTDAVCAVGCAMQCSGGGPGLSQTASTLALVPVASLFAAFRADAVIAPADFGPHNPRGPPRA